MPERRQQIEPGNPIAGQLDEIRQLLAQLVKRVSGGVRIGRVIISVQGARASTSACRADVVHVLRTATHRMTARQIMSELARSGKVYGERTIKGVLAQLVDEAIADNEPNVKPRGYRLVR
jgi:hypothetical protein